MNKSKREAIEKIVVESEGTWNSMYQFDGLTRTEFEQVKAEMQNKPSFDDRPMKQVRRKAPRSETKRYDVGEENTMAWGEECVQGKMWHSETGEYVKHTDHLAAVQQARIDAVREIREKVRVLTKLQHRPQVLGVIDTAIKQLKEQGYETMDT